jgi:hypothetical protein
MPIKDLPRSKLYPAEAAMFAKSLLVILIKITGVDLITKLYNALKVLLEKLEERTGQNLKLVLTEPTAVRDARRDQFHGQMVKYVKGQCSAPDESVAASAVKIFDILISHDLQLANKSYDVESHHINALIMDLKDPQIRPDIEAVNIAGLLNNLEQSQKEFEEITQEKVEKKSQTVSQILGLYVAPIRRKIFQILVIIDTIEEFEPELYKSVVSEINALIDEYVTKIRARTTIMEKKAELVSVGQESAE